MRPAPARGGPQPAARALGHDRTEPSALVGREVEFRTVGDLSRYFRDEVAGDAQVLYDAA